MRNYFIYISLIIISSSCVFEQPEGEWEDNIKLSTKELHMNADTDSAFITTEGDSWWISDIVFNDRTYLYEGQNTIDVLTESFVISEDEFLFEKKDKNTMFIRLSSNNSNTERHMTITLQAGNYFDHINIIQACKKD